MKSEIDKWVLSGQERAFYCYYSLLRKEYIFDGFWEVLKKTTELFSRRCNARASGPNQITTRSAQRQWRTLIGRQADYS